MTTDFSTPYSPSGVNIYGSGISASKADPPSPLHWRTFKLPASDPEKDIAIGWELKIDDLRGGYAQYGDFSRGGSQYDGDYRKTSISTLDQRFDRHLLLPPKVTQTTLASAGPGNGCLFHCSFGPEKKLLMGGGSEANFALFTETSSTDPTPAAVTYVPGAPNVVSISAGVLNSTDERPIVGLDNSSVARYFDANLAASTAMHANSANLWSSQRTNINAATPGLGGNLLYAGTSIYFLAENAAIAAAPTQVLQNVPSGGCGLGVEQLQKNWPLRVFWWWPLASSTTSAIQLGYPGQVVTTNLEGGDPQPIPTSLSRVYFACLWNHMVVMTDGVRVEAYDGEHRYDLGFLGKRLRNTDYRWGCSGFAVDGDALYAMVARADLTVGAGVGVSELSLERYMPDFNAWAQVSQTMTAANSLLGSASVDAAREMPYGRIDALHNWAMTMPISRQTGFLHLNMRNSAKWNRMFISPEGVNPFYHYSQTGSGAEIAQEFASTGTWYSPYFSLPTLEGREKQVDQVVFLGVIDEGNVKVTINPNQGGLAVTFAGTDETRAQSVDGSGAHFDLLQLSIQLNQGSSARKTPNGLPIVIRGRAYLTDPDVDTLGLPGGFI